VAVTLAARRAGQHRLTIAFGVVAAIFVYTTVANMIERPDGLKIGGFFIVTILLVSFLSRLFRALELRVAQVSFDRTADVFLRDCSRRRVRLIANEPDNRDPEEYRLKLEETHAEHDFSDDDVIFVEVTVSDPSEFESSLDVHGEIMHGQYRVMTVTSTSVPNALAALLLEVRNRTRRLPHIYFEWTEGSPLTNGLRFLLFGVGEVAPVTREILREAEPDRRRRPHVHVG
jgi:hypothetical protein